MAVDPARQAQLAAILTEHQAAGEFVGARIAVRDADGTISEASGGTPTLDPASGPVDPDVPWNIGSATKTFVATVVLQLADEGRIDLDAGIDRYVPYLPGGGPDHSPPAPQPHQRARRVPRSARRRRAEPKRQWTPAEQVAIAEAAGRFGEPGGPHHYSNTNYIVLGDIIEQVTGRSWVDEVQARIAGPLGMTHTGLTGTAGSCLRSRRRHPGRRHRRLRPVHRRRRRRAPVDQPRPADLRQGARRRHCSSRPSRRRRCRQFLPAEDLSRFGIDHGYGLGIERYAMDGMTVIGHMGTGETGSSYVGYDAETGTTVAVTTNTAISGPSAIMAVEALTAARAAG